MKVVILAGGFGTRLSEETDMKPKPMVEIGGKPILWHIMKIYSGYGFNEFVILLGYKGYLIKEYFSNYFLHQSNVTIDLANNKMDVHHHECEAWKVTLLETGLLTMTGGRIKRAADHIGRQTFLLTYGDGVSNIDISKLLKFHQAHGKQMTMTAVQPAGRYGSLNIEEDGLVADFMEKPKGDGAWINGGFFVCEPDVLELISGDETVFEEEPLTKLAKNKQLVSYRHNGFWECMDTLRDKRNLDLLWDKQQAPWKNWSD
ncbi:glucose-1-phosphate cytidylyltransferase [Deltaproteobacteria bacterium]|nr:glucose-1-phosphate cytidylyltransferase [Deltaproteobacteria bacterium]